MSAESNAKNLCHDCKPRQDYRGDFLGTVLCAKHDLDARESKPSEAKRAKVCCGSCSDCNLCLVCGHPADHPGHRGDDDGMWHSFVSGHSGKPPMSKEVREALERSLDCQEHHFKYVNCDCREKNYKALATPEPAKNAETCDECQGVGVVFVEETDSQLACPRCAPPTPPEPKECGACSGDGQIEYGVGCISCGGSGTVFEDPMTDVPTNCRNCPPTPPEKKERP